MAKKKREMEGDDFSFEETRRRKNTRNRNGSGKLLWLTLIGGTLAVGGGATVLVLMNSEEKGAPAKLPEILVAKKPEIPRQQVSKESQEWKDRWFRLTPGRSLQDIDEAMQASFRPITAEEAARFFADRSDREFAMKEFRANIERLRVKKWYSWTRNRDVYLAGFSRYKDGNWYMTMRGVYLEPEKSTFFIMPLAVVLEMLAEGEAGRRADLVPARMEETW